MYLKQTSCYRKPILPPWCEGKLNFCRTLVNIEVLGVAVLLCFVGLIKYNKNLITIWLDICLKMVCKLIILLLVEML